MVEIKKRIVERHQYNPKRSWDRQSRVFAKVGAVETFKKAGDIIISPLAAVEVIEDGWSPAVRPYSRAN